VGQRYFCCLLSRMSLYRPSKIGQLAFRLPIE
jgi:hypothetical protein